MEWEERLQNIIDYVEEHLQRREEGIREEEIALLAGCSYGFFLKVFSYMRGISFAEYIRCRKMTLAGYDLKSTNLKVVDLSYKYGYDSPTSFSKAFRIFHGISPREAREKDAGLRVFPKMQVSGKKCIFPAAEGGFSEETGRNCLTEEEKREVSGFYEGCWRLVRKPAIRMVGKSREIPCGNGEHYEKIPEFWNDCQKDGTYVRLISMDTGTRKGLFGVFGSTGEESGKMQYSIMVISEKELPEGYQELLLPETVWAVFDFWGAVPQAIQAGWKYLTEEWLVKYPFRHAACPELEWYSDGNAYSANYLSQIWIPIEEDSYGTFSLL